MVGVGGWGVGGALFPTFLGCKTDFWEEMGDGKVEWVRNSFMLIRRGGWIGKFDNRVELINFSQNAGSLHVEFLSYYY